MLPAPASTKRKIASNILDSSESPSQVFDQQRNVDVPKNWTTLEPRGQELVGIYAVLVSGECENACILTNLAKGWNMIENFGLISMNRP